MKAVRIGLATALALLILALTPWRAPARTEDTMARLSAGLDRTLEGQGGKWALLVEDLDTGLTARSERGVTCGDPMISASLEKLFIMAECYTEIEAGNLSEDAVSGDIYQRIVVSDNEATNRLIEILGDGDAAAGMDRVNEYCTRAGFDACRLNRLMPEDDGQQNYVSAEDCAKLLRMLWEGRCVSPARSAHMLSILCDQVWDDYIPQGPPKGTVIAHKDGDLPWLSHGDVGIVYDPEGAYIECVICNHPTADSRARRALAAAAKTVDRHMGKGRSEKRALMLVVVLSGAVLTGAFAQKRKED